jgi:hypothetical protein
LLKKWGKTATQLILAAKFIIFFKREKKSKYKEKPNPKVLAFGIRKHLYKQYLM